MRHEESVRVLERDASSVRFVVVVGAGGSTIALRAERVEGASVIEAASPSEARAPFRDAALAAARERSSVERGVRATIEDEGDPVAGATLSVSLFAEAGRRAGAVLSAWARWPRVSDADLARVAEGERTWTWQHDGGPHSATIDLVGGDVVWWSALDPRGDPIDELRWRQAIECFVRGDRGFRIRGLTDETAAEIRASLAETADLLAARPPVDRLVAAARVGAVPALVALLDAGASPDAPDVRGRAALWSAIENHRDEAARVLVERGVAVTPPPEAAPHDLVLHAASNRLFEAAAALLAHGGLRVDESGIAQHWMVAYRERAPLDLVRALAAKARRLDANAIAYATRLAHERSDAAALAWLAAASQRAP